MPARRSGRSFITRPRPAPRRPTGSRSTRAGASGAAYWPSGPCRIAPAGTTEGWSPKRTADGCGFDRLRPAVPGPRARPARRRDPALGKPGRGPVARPAPRRHSGRGRILDEPLGGTTVALPSAPDAAFGWPSPSRAPPRGRGAPPRDARTRSGPGPPPRRDAVRGQPSRIGRIVPPRPDGRPAAPRRPRLGADAALSAAGPRPRRSSPHLPLRLRPRPRGRAALGATPAVRRAEPVRAHPLGPRPDARPVQSGDTPGRVAARGGARAVDDPRNGLLIRGRDARERDLVERHLSGQPPHLPRVHQPRGSRPDDRARGARRPLPLRGGGRPRVARPRRRSGRGGPPLQGLPRSAACPCPGGFRARQRGALARVDVRPDEPFVDPPTGPRPRRPPRGLAARRGPRWRARGGDGGTPA